MSDIFYDAFIEEWVPKQANIIADLEHSKNLADHLVTTEIMYMKLNGFLNKGLIPQEHIEEWQVLGFSILTLQHRIYNVIPDFPSKQRGQLQALSKEVKKEERFHNDTVLARGNTLSEEDFLKKLKESDIMIKHALVTPDKTLKIILNNPIIATIANTATFLSRTVDSHGMNLKKLILYDAANAKVIQDVTGTELFVKPL
jgi:hypothetical protein